MYGYIYLIKDHWTNKIYIGQKKGLEEQTKKYFGSGTIIKPIIKKRKHLLEKRIIGYCETKESLDEAEIYCIEFFNSRNPIYGYNITTGGEDHATTTGKILSKEHKNKISNSLKGNKHLLGYKFSESSKQKISNSLIGNKSRSGMTNTKESNLKRAKTLKGIIRSKETKEKIRQAAIKRWSKERENGTQLHTI